MKISILIADDDDIFRELLEDILRKMVIMFFQQIAEKMQ